MRFKLTLFLLIISVGLGVCGGVLLAITRGVPSIEELKNYRALPSTMIYADDDTLLAEVKIEKGVFVQTGKMPRYLLDAVVAVEDSRFWKHSGIDYLAILRAALTDVIHREIKQGGSTITQQLAKITFLTPERTLKRKLKEASLAIKIEKNLEKEEIIELYLNRVYFGHGAYGVEMAARTYFGKPVSKLTLPEAALIAGLIRAPAIYSPFNNFKKAKDRQKIVLWRMFEESYISKKEMEEAMVQPVYLSSVRAAEKNNYFVEYVKGLVSREFGEDMLYKGGLKVYTTLDKYAQSAADAALKSGLRELDKRRGWRGPVDHREPEELEKEKDLFKSIPREGDIIPAVVVGVGKDSATVKAGSIMGSLSLADASWARYTYDRETGEVKPTAGFSLKKILAPGDVIAVKVKSMRGKVEFALDQEPEVQGAVVAMDPHSGYIRAMIGGYDFSKSPYNRAVRAERQPGSAFKPVVYSVALENGMSPSTIMIDDEASYDDGAGGFWSPKNYDEDYYGPITLRDSLAYSRNVVTVKLVDYVGVSKVIRFARSLGIKSRLPHNLTIALGSMSITPLDLTACYGAFANGGVKMEPTAIKYVTDSKGRVLASFKPEGRRVMDPETAYLITSMMKSVVEYGTGWKIKVLRRPVAGKTGTTNDFRDAWFLGYTVDMVSGVWVGMDDGRPLGKGETGSRAAVPVWLDFMKSVSGSQSPEDFPMPEGIVITSVDPYTGLPAESDATYAVREYFRKDTVPMSTVITTQDLKEETDDFIDDEQAGFSGLTKDPE